MRRKEMSFTASRARLRVAARDVRSQFKRSPWVGFALAVILHPSRGPLTLDRELPAEFPPSRSLKSCCLAVGLLATGVSSCHPVYFQGPLLLLRGYGVCQNDARLPLSRLSASPLDRTTYTLRHCLDLQRSLPSLAYHQMNSIVLPAGMCFEAY